MKDLQVFSHSECAVNLQVTAHESQKQAVER